MSKRIVAFLIDRLPATSLGCYGSWQNPTPHVDAFASRSLACSNFYRFDNSQPVIPASHCEVIHVTPDDVSHSVDEELLTAAWATWVGIRPEGMELDALADLWQLYTSQPRTLTEHPVPERLAIHAAWVRAADQWIGEQLALIEPTLQPGDLLLVTASAGEALAFRELGVDLQHPLQPATQHLPLIIATPGLSQRPQRLLAPGGPEDLHALIHRLLDGPDPSDVVLDDWRRELETRQSLHANCETHSVHMTAAWACLHPLDENGISSDSDVLFHRPEDPWGLMNVANQYPHIVEQFRQKSRPH